MANKKNDLYKPTRAQALESAIALTREQWEELKMKGQSPAAPGEAEDEA